jgi:cyclase
MLKVRVIPILLVKDGGLNKPVQFRRPRTVASPISIVRVFEERKVDELILLDIGCSGYDEPVNADFVRTMAEELTVPLAVGGGIKDIETMRRLIAAGAEKIVINTAAVEAPDIVAAGARLFGRQAMVVSIDAKKTDNGDYEVRTRNGTHPTGLSPIDCARQAARLGAGEILICSIDRDGTMTGYDLGLLGSVARAVDIPVIGAGGAGSVQDFVDAVKIAQVSAVAAGSIYHFRHVTPLMVKVAMRDAGIPVRLPMDLGQYT